jgi:hypothetical protein
MQRAQKLQRELNDTVSVSDFKKVVTRLKVLENKIDNIERAAIKPSIKKLKSVKTKKSKSKDPFYSKENMAEIERAIKDVENGNFVEYTAEQFRAIAKAK